MRFKVIFFTCLLFCPLWADSSYPYLSGYTWWHFCDWKLTNPDFGEKEYSKFDPVEVHLGDTVFVEYDCLQQFATDYLPLLQEKIILITANYGYHADMPLPGPYAFLLHSDKVAAWFVQNIDREPSEKLIPIPIGLANRCWPHGDFRLFDQIAPQERSIFIYLNFSLSPERIACENHFALMGIRKEPPKPYASYLEDLSRSVFVISPPGGGLDCHRTWEALLMGCYPVVISNTLNPLYEDLPVVIVKDWNEVTEEFLEAEYRALKSGAREKLYFPYWEQKVRDLQSRLRNQKSPFSWIGHASR